jgi:hypothetical protein
MPVTIFKIGSEACIKVSRCDRFAFRGSTTGAQRDATGGPGTAIDPPPFVPFSAPSLFLNRYVNKL